MKEKMFITRIGDKKVLNLEADIVDISSGKFKIRITPDFDNSLRIHKDQFDFESMTIKPGCANEIVIS